MATRGTLAFQTRAHCDVRRGGRMPSEMSDAREELAVGAETDLHPIAEADPDRLVQAKREVISGYRRALMRLKIGTHSTLTPGLVWVDDITYLPGSHP